MDLHVVREKCHLLWPVEFIDKPETHTVNGWHNYLRRHPKQRMRGTAGYVVDLDGPLEAEWCAGQGLHLTPVAELGKKRGRPKGPDKITLEPALAAILAFEQAQAAAGEAEALAPAGTRAAPKPASKVGLDPVKPAPDAETRADTTEHPEVEGCLYVPYTGTLAQAWQGRYETPGETVTHLLRVGESEPVPIGDVAPIEVPAPLRP